MRTTGEVRIGSIGLSKTVDHWINDGLMAVFFLLVGLEIKREAIEGPLSSAKQAALPVIAAFGGFVTPAAIFAAVNWGDAHALRGWAIPAATDIAFALGVCAMLGRKVPASLKIFLMALAIIDDLMAIIVIAIFYTADLSVTALALGGLGVAALAVLNLLDVRRPSFYLIAGLFTWVCVLKSGVHATLAGVAVGLAMPLTRRDGHSLLEDTEHALRPWVIFVIVPIFRLRQCRRIALWPDLFKSRRRRYRLASSPGFSSASRSGCSALRCLRSGWAWLRCRKAQRWQSSMPWPS